MENERVKKEAPKSVGRVNGGFGDRSEFWRELAWRCGDDHASRICKWVDVYCWLFGLERERFFRVLPRG